MFKYKEIKKLSEENEMFFSSIQEIVVNNKTYLIESFSYRFATWFDFQKNPLLKELRGISFIKEKNSLDTPILFTIWYHKFFNYWEGEWEKSTMNILKTVKIKSIVDKIDWSLIMFWKIDWEIIAKSKTSIKSEQAVAANKLINNNSNLYNFINSLLEQKIYPIFELVWPEFRIVLNYDSEKLVLLWARSENWSYMPFDKLSLLAKKYNIAITEKKDLKLYEILKLKETDEWYEWFIIELENEERIKVKLNSYVELHSVKDNINNRKKLVKLALDEDLDDLRSLFSSKPEYLKIINDIEIEVFKFMNDTIEIVNNDYNKNKHLSIKEFAILNKDKNHFRLLMQIYKNFEPSYKEYVFDQLV